MNPYIKPGLYIDAELIRKAVAENYQIPVGLLFAKTRKSEVREPRQVAMLLEALHNKTTLNKVHYVRIAKNYNKDHVTVIHAVKSLCQRYIVDPDFNYTIIQICKKLGLRHTSINLEYFKTQNKNGN